MAEALLSKSKCCEFESHFGHQFFWRDGSVKKIKWKRLSLYLLRWQMSSPILAMCILFLPFDDITKTIVANFIGGLIFYRLDKLIFGHKKKEENKGE